MFITMGRFFWVQNLIWVLIMLVQVHGNRGCIEKERNGLLELLVSPSDDIPNWSTNETKSESSRIVVSPSDGIPNRSNESKSDCCRWEKVKCDLTSGRVIGLSLYESDYSYSNPLLNLSLLYPFEELQELNLSGSLFDGWFDNIEGYKSLGRLKKLRILDLSENAFNNSILAFLSAAVSLKTVILRQNLLDGPFPIKELKNLGNLEVLDLSDNNFKDSLPMHGLFDLNKLTMLDLSGNKFSGPVAQQGICELKNLRELDLSKNAFVGQVPLCFGSLKNLRLLDLSSNQLSGKVPPIFNTLESLEYLSLSNNRFDGLFSFDSLANLSRLKVFKLSSLSHLLQIIETKRFWQPNLTVIELPHCNLEKIPSFFLNQKDLRLVDLSNNQLSGNFPTWLLENNTGLEVLFLPKNSLRSFQLPKFTHNLRYLDVSANDFDNFLPENFGKVFPNMIHMNLSKNGFQGHLPSSLDEMKTIYFMDLSHNNFSGELPRSFVMGCYSLDILRLSNNNFSGQIFPNSTTLTSLSVLNMDNNKFSGKLGDGFLNLSSLAVLDISNNFLNGTIPRWFGNFSTLSMLLMANNFLEGTLPDSLFQIARLQILDFSGNMLSGTLHLPSNPNLKSERQLYLYDNDFEGSIPKTLLENVGILDLRNNKLSGNIPQFVNTQNISILLLRGNNLKGHIPKSLCELSNIRLLDLADNKLSGSIPSCLNDITFGSGEDAKQPDYEYSFAYMVNNGVGKYYRYMLLVDQFNVDYRASLEAEIKFAAKQRYDSYKRGALYFMFGLDLSNNELSGEIPMEFGDLRKLRALNLSHNNLSGSIPPSFSNMKDMESLDLCFNGLSGRILPQLTGLNSLSVFNVSYNNLSGVIPQEGQFSTLNETNYIGNPFLCGPPVNRSCNDNPLETPNKYGGKDDDEAAVDMVTFLWSFGATYVTVLMGMLVFLCIDSTWSRAWFCLIDAFISWVKGIWSSY